MYHFHISLDLYSIVKFKSVLVLNLYPIRLLNAQHSLYPFAAKLCSLFLQGWLEKYPKRASVLRLAGEGNWTHQFRAVALIRISPFPYIIYNYCAVATNVRYGPYILGSLVGMVPEIFVTIYTYVCLT